MAPTPIENAHAPAPAQATAPEPAWTDRVHILFLGDTSFGENYQAAREAQGRLNVISTRGYDYSLAGVAPLLHDQDFVVGNLETPLFEPGHSPLAGEKRYIHWSDPRRATVVLRRHGFGAVSLANNHAFDYGEEGLRSTLEALGRHGIAAFGAGLYEQEACRPFMSEFPCGDSAFRLAVVGGKHQIQRDRPGAAVGLKPGVNVWTPKSAARQVAALRRSDPGLFLVAFPHWGRNYEWRSDEQHDLARALVDAGADLVLGHGAHMIQEIERYRDRWIVYGLGNFMFNSPGRYRRFEDAVPYGFAARLTATRKEDTITLRLRLYPLLIDNRVIRYQPRPVSPEELGEITQCLLGRSPSPDDLRHAWTIDADAIGPYVDFDLPFVVRLAASSSPTAIERADP